MPISTVPFEKTVYGLSGRFTPGKVWETVKPLMDRMWRIIHSGKLPTEGINHWIYSGKGNVFVGVILTSEEWGLGDLEKKQIRLEKYGTWKHKGNFAEIQRGYSVLRDEILRAGEKEGNTSIEIYGHVSDADPQSEMEILIEIE